MGGQAWRYVPSCPCDACENFRAMHGMSCMFGMGPRPEQERLHNFGVQEALPSVEVPWTDDKPVMG